MAVVGSVAVSGSGVPDERARSILEHVRDTVQPAHASVWLKPS